MPLPAPGLVRVYARHSVGMLRGHRWQDVPEGYQPLEGFLEAGLVSLTGPRGETAPDDLPPPRCCGDR